MSGKMANFQNLEIQKHLKPNPIFSIFARLARLARHQGDYRLTIKIFCQTFARHLIDLPDTPF